VIGGTRASRQDFRSLVGKQSSKQVESLESRINFLISFWVAGVNDDIVGGDEKELPAY